MCVREVGLLLIKFSKGDNKLGENVRPKMVLWFYLFIALK